MQVAGEAVTHWPPGSRKIPVFYDSLLATTGTGSTSRATATVTLSERRERRAAERRRRASAERRARPTALSFVRDVIIIISMHHDDVRNAESCSDVDHTARKLQKIEQGKNTSALCHVKPLCEIE